MEGYLRVFRPSTGGWSPVNLFHKSRSIEKFSAENFKQEWIELDSDILSCYDRLDQQEKKPQDPKGTLRVGKLIISKLQSDEHGIDYGMKFSNKKSGKDVIYLMFNDISEANLWFAVLETAQTFRQIEWERAHHREFLYRTLHIDPSTPLSKSLIEYASIEQMARVEGDQKLTHRAERCREMLLEIHYQNEKWKPSNVMSYDAVLERNPLYDSGMGLQFRTHHVHGHLYVSSIDAGMLLRRITKIAQSIQVGDILEGIDNDSCLRWPLTRVKARLDVFRVPVGGTVTLHLTRSMMRPGQSEDSASPDQHNVRLELVTSANKAAQIQPTAGSTMREAISNTDLELSFGDIYPWSPSSCIAGEVDGINNSSSSSRDRKATDTTILSQDGKCSGYPGEVMGQNNFRGRLTSQSHDGYVMRPVPSTVMALNSPDHVKDASANELRGKLASQSQDGYLVGPIPGSIVLLNSSVGQSSNGSTNTSQNKLTSQSQDGFLSCPTLGSVVTPTSICHSSEGQAVHASHGGRTSTINSPGNLINGHVVGPIPLDRVAPKSPPAGGRHSRERQLGDASPRSSFKTVKSQAADRLHGSGVQPEALRAVGLSASQGSSREEAVQQSTDCPEEREQEKTAIGENEQRDYPYAPEYDDAASSVFDLPQSVFMNLSESLDSLHVFFADSVAVQFGGVGYTASNKDRGSSKTRSGGDAAEDAGYFADSDYPAADKQGNKGCSEWISFGPKQPKQHASHRSWAREQNSTEANNQQGDNGSDAEDLASSVFELSQSVFIDLSESLEDLRIFFINSFAPQFEANAAASNEGQCKTASAEAAEDVGSFADSDYSAIDDEGDSGSESWDV